MAMLVYQSVYFLEGQFLVKPLLFGEHLGPKPTASAAWLQADQLLEQKHLMGSLGEKFSPFFFG